jgi:tRNA (cmo5U34)-methyltransferase
MKIPHDWTFKSAEVAAGFDKHVHEQLPWYDLTTGVIAHVARHYIPEGGMVYDIGASTGNIGKALSDTLETRHARFVALDNSESMKANYSGPGSLTVSNALTFEYEPFDFAVCFLVLMFIPPSKRAGLIAKLRAQTNPGGALVVFDKCQPVHGYVATVMSRLALAGKVSAGVDAREIIAKELSLAGVQRPIDPRELGGDAQEIFRFGDFAGWVIESPSATVADRKEQDLIKL